MPLRAAWTSRLKLSEESVKYANKNNDIGDAVYMYVFAPN